MLAAGVISPARPTPPIVRPVRTNMRLPKRSARTLAIACGETQTSVLD